MGKAVEAGVSLVLFRANEKQGATFHLIDAARASSSS